MKQKHTLQWLSAVTGKAKGLVGLLVLSMGGEPERLRGQQQEQQRQRERRCLPQR